MTEQPKLVVEAAWKWFGERDVLCGLDLTVMEHEVVCLIGSSGSGKSTLLKVIDLLEPLDDGRVLLDGVDITEPGVDQNAVRRRLGIVFQSFNLFPHLSVLDNVTLGPRRVLGNSRPEAEERARSLLDRFGLDAHHAAYPDQLSGGQQQRTAIVRSLAMEPELLLLDEITSALDPELVGEVLDVVRELSSSGMTMILATHEMGFARETADRICVLDGGRIVEAGTPTQVFERPEHQRTAQLIRRFRESGRT